MRDSLQKINSIISKLIAAPLGKIKNRLFYSHLANEGKSIWVNTNDILYWYSGNRYENITWAGQIIGGDWTNRLVAREDRLKNRSGYIGLYERFKEGKPWRETMLFQEKHIKLLETRGDVKGFDNLEELEHYYEKRYDRLFEKIKKEGLLPANGENPEIDPIYIHIGPEGELIYTVDGNHRFYIAEILGIEKMPVKVWMRHKKWQKIREHILGRKGQDIAPEYQKYLDHPDIAGELE